MPEPFSQQLSGGQPQRVVLAHDLDVAGAVAEQVAVMRAGRIVESGRTADVFRSPAHPYTQTLLQAATAVGRL